MERGVGYTLGFEAIHTMERFAQGEFTWAFNTFGKHKVWRVKVGLGLTLGGWGKSHCGVEMLAGSAGLS